MFRLLSCKVKEDRANILMDEEVEDDQCPTSDALQEQLRDFCVLLVEKLLGKKEDDVLDTSLNAIKELEEEKSWVDNLAQFVISVPPTPKDADYSINRNGTENFRLKLLKLKYYNFFRKMIISTLSKWANDSQIESNELIRSIFKLLLRQYAGVKEVF